MVVITVLLGLYALMVSAYWLYMTYGSWRLQGLPSLGDMGEPERPPRVSVVVPACNEADKLEAAFRSLMRQDYPNLELILVEDRSTDDTAQIADRLGAHNERVKVIHVKDLPEGWLGKVHAMKLGYEASSGEYVLFTDADVHFSRAILRAIAFCQKENLDHLVVIPRLRSAGLATDAIIESFLRPFMMIVARPWKVSDPKSKAFMGIGAFNMVRREAFERTDKLDWLRMEVGDDMALGLII